MCAIFLMNVKKRTKIALGKNLKFEIIITHSKIVQMSSSFAYMAMWFFCVFMIDTKKPISIAIWFLNGQNQNFDHFLSNVTKLSI